MTFSRILVFVTILAVVLGGAHFYLWLRLVREPGWPRRTRRILTTILAIGCALPIGYLAASRALHGARTAVAWAAFVWLGFFFFLFFSALASHLLSALAKLTLRLKQGTPVDPSRRELVARLAAGITGVLGLALGTAGLVSALSRTSVQRIHVRLKKLPPSANGYRIVQITDVHVGPMIHEGFIETIVAQINALDADAVVITGDLVDGSVDELERHVAPLAKIRAKDGVFFVTGNHEYYSGADSWIAHLGTLGIKVLRNEHVTLREGLHLAGVDDAGAHQFAGHGSDLAKATAGRNPDDALVLLAHQPKAIFDAIRHGVDLQLSGHTHGGQLFPWNYMVRLQQPYNAGLFAHPGSQTQIYVSRGTGYWGPPMRVGAPAEITEIVLDRA